MSVNVSVIVPVYNAGEFLEDTIEKLCNQTLKDIEIILVDDGSTDKSAEICDRLAKTDGRIRVVHTQNRGVCAARNTGIELAVGEYIGFCDADDEPALRLFETLYKLAEDNGCEVAMVKYATVFEDGKVTDDTSSHRLKIYENKNDVLADFLLGKLYSGVYTKIFKRDLCKKISFEVGRRINEDKMFIFDALRTANSWCYKDESLYTYIRREGSSSNSTFSEKQFDCIYFADKMQNIVQSDYSEIIDCAKCNSVYSYLKLLKIMCLTGGTAEYADKFDEYTKYLRGYKISFCRKYLRKNDFIKWLGLKINKGLFAFLVKKFART